MGNKARIPDSENPRVVIVGGGFAGIELAKSLNGVNVQVVLIDKTNHHTFQPLLYQVSTAGLEAESIVYPFRKIFDEQPNFFFRLAQVISVDTQTQVVETSIGFLRYDYLVIATGATTNFYGNKEIEKNSIPIKNIIDALSLRNTILSNFEKALQIEDDEQLNSLIDFVIVGGGPTGVELAGALSELRKHVFPNDYKELDFLKMDIHIIQSGPRILNGMSEEASLKALQFLENLNVKVWLNRRVESYDGYTVVLDSGEKLITRTLIWAAGVSGAPIEGLDKKCILKGSRIQVDEYSKVVGYTNIFAIGDIAAMVTPDNPQGHPMMAQPAIQQGRLLGENLTCILTGKPLKPFHYKDQGSMATIGRHRAVADLKINKKEYKMQGWFAWFIWMFVHLISIIGFRNRLFVFLNWIWSYISYDKGIRLIIGNPKSNKPVEEEVPKALN
ncbi:NAD(P)/FAD-dependent oxidoreductase [Xanthocytophaga agilis]|uniref:NADH:ubiquinone reductase (non-electrogenic) n=1 Tax=Xanthocytophaga agilis TaxID=3048010 RepID=A0AAE3UIT9_9BACT|nr:NAD(P)/FAD-dependent oxidoreductase [Xanthocytophaga agilis]MDJ1504872.1 NAD(P)/FAD-dependent oxidoreductase [Xanthocytophaga agilis]